MRKIDFDENDDNDDEINDEQSMMLLMDGRRIKLTLVMMTQRELVTAESKGH